MYHIMTKELLQPATVPLFLATYIKHSFQEILCSSSGTRTPIISEGKKEKNKKEDKMCKFVS
jgi:hypothetical protein